MTQAQAAYVVKNTTPLDDTASLAEVEAAIPSEELDALDAIGDSRDDARWKAGDMAVLWIDVRKLPADQCLAIIAKRTDWGKESIRKFLYCSRFYTDRAELRERYHQLRHSIFDHARQCSDPEAVLEAANNPRMTPTLIKNSYPALLDELDLVYNRVAKTEHERAKEIVAVAIGKLKELEK